MYTYKYHNIKAGKYLFTICDIFYNNEFLDCYVANRIECIY